MRAMGEDFVIRIIADDEDDTFGGVPPLENFRTWPPAGGRLAS
ncbi:hypothetical protein AVEN_46552-1, partial [Araneus ventricosus]